MISDILGSVNGLALLAKESILFRHSGMDVAVLGLFTIVNSIRIFAYIPQILRAAKDQNGASAISYTTWGLFLLSHLTTIAYAIVCQGDGVMAAVFLGNALACLAIISVTFLKRRRHAHYLVGPEKRSHFATDPHTDSNRHSVPSGT
jgi:uncharacterized protein with PQ loop repeat